MGQFCARLRRKVNQDEISVYVNDLASNEQYGYPSNEIRTTKYTILTFVPKFLFEQFRRVANLYFLLLMIITLIPGISPISPYSAVVPFVLIMLVNAAKEIYEDGKRRESDEELNNRRYDVLRGPSIISLKNKFIRVGDILYISENQEVPADCLILNTSHQDGVCYVETSNLDGETNLKLFKAIPETLIVNMENVANIKGLIKAEQPNEIMYSFKGNIEIVEGSDKILHNPILDDSSSSNISSITGKQLLMRGVRIRNTEWVLATVVYAGKHTKLAMNQVSPPSKFSRTEKRINVVTGALFGIKMLFVVIAVIVSVVTDSGTSDPTKTWYIPLLKDPAYDAGTVFLSYFVLLGYFIPISLFVNLEIIKLIQAGFMMFDQNMKYNDLPMRVKNSNLNDELSRVSYIFSDKTGTLTQNKMEFMKCSIGSEKYDRAGDGQLRSKLSNSEISEFFLHIALNNEVLPEEKKDNEDGDKISNGDDEYYRNMPHYAAPTPDEVALVKGAYKNGVKLLQRTNKGITVDYYDSGSGKSNNVTSELYEILDTLEFSSARKRSTVIVRMPDGKITMYTKGADSIIMARLSKSTKKSLLQTINRHLTEYSEEGLRTLVFGKKQLTNEEYKKFKEKFKSASTAINNREKLMEDVMDEMETDLEVQGCSAIQDKLQENVPEAIDFFVKCGIKVWMITGDKQETAENIGLSCKLLSKDTTIARVVKCKQSEDCEKLLDEAERLVRNNSKVTLVIDGESLVFALLAHDQKLLHIGRQCDTVIVCRADPLQKALVVRLIKRGTKKICLSIGDGANDVSMIQEANIGVGIWGEEGTQAARNSDYAIRRFSHLMRLVALHGRNSMLRNARMVEFSFYKNIGMFASQFWFGIYNLFSAQTFFDDWFMAGYNTIMLLIPPLAMAIFDRDLRDHLVFEYPEVYKELKKGLYLTTKSLISWSLSAFYASLVIFFSQFLMSDILHNGQTIDHWVTSTTVGVAGLFAITFRSILATRHWVVLSLIGTWGSLTLPFILLLTESQMVSFFPKFYKVMDVCVSSPTFWLMIPLVTVICLLPDFCFEYLSRQVKPKKWQIVQELGNYQLKNEPDSTSIRPASTTRNTIIRQSKLEEDSSSEDIEDNHHDNNNNNNDYTINKSKHQSNILDDNNNDDEDDDDIL
eukprot:TRINITY_DN2680_c1_g1_i1.p1 TRINITY_DN2680_c1_g1~~TRINITY_DN2680_c1_g1_i1.p1  ORF type:complete len:1154 (+),score=239.21 TRINITY_DN2680_c1_g1_i1:18-3479(+)